MPKPVLAVDRLTVEFSSATGPVRAVNDVSLSVAPGETLGIIGESGSGKSVTAMSVLRLLPQPTAQVRNGRILLGDEDLLTCDARALRDVRGRRVSMIFQDPTTSLHPAYTIGAQLAEVLTVHDRKLSKRAARRKSTELLTSVGIGQAEHRIDQYPHQFSGGMRQRCMIAMAIANRPSVIIADEPTTELDVSIQAEILDLMAVIKAESDAAIVFITHDLRVVAQIADRVAVMYAGSIVESGAVRDVFENPKHPYTSALLKSLPALDRRADRQTSIQGSPPDPSALPVGCSFHPRCEVFAGRSQCVEERPVLKLVPRTSAVGEGHETACHFSSEAPTAPVDLRRHVIQDDALSASSAAEASPILQVEGLQKRFALGRRIFGGANAEVLAVDDVSFEVFASKTLALVGESGSGKSTTARLILRLHEPSAGSVRFGDIDLASASGSELRRARRDIQMIFQDPFGSLNPRLSAWELVAEPLRIQAMTDQLDRVDRLLDRVGLSPQQWHRRPSAFSGGQRQRIAIARALVLEPRLLVLDEAVSALDVSIQAQVLNLLVDLQAELGVAYLFISHDLAVVRQLADTVAVMFAGRIVEHGAADDIYHSARHPYTRALLEAVPGAASWASESDSGLSSPRPAQISETSATPASEGCPYRLRCPLAADICKEENPSLNTIEGTAHRIACHFGDVVPELVHR